MNDPRFLAWTAAKRCERRASRVRERRKLEILQKIVFKKMCRDENYLKKRAFRRIKKSNICFARFLKRRFKKMGFEKVPFSIKLWMRDRIIKPKKLNYMYEDNPW